MSNFMLMKPTNQTFGGLFSNGVKYNIPKFQRDYAWELEQWEDLWNDIKHLGDEEQHYMGYIVLQKKKENEYEVIDGQQRLITISLIIVAAMRKIQDFIDNGVEVEANEKRLTVYREHLIGELDTIILTVENKLSLNRNNHRNFRKISSTMKAVQEIRMSRTNILLNKAFDFFLKLIPATSGQEIAKFVKVITTQLIFTTIVTENNVDAYKLFESLNARGVQLSTPDLLKNYIFSTLTMNDDVSDTTLDILDEDWATIISQLGEGNFADFVLYHHKTQNELMSKRGLFKSIKNIITIPKTANAYLSSLSTYASIYSALLKPSDEYWRIYEQERKEIVHYLDVLMLFDMKQPFSILMVVIADNFSNAEIAKTMKYFYILSVRYNIICKLSPREQDIAYNKIAMKIFNKELTRASHIKNCDEFKKLYPNDDTFRNSFEFYRLPSRRASKKIRFLLAEIENSFGKKLNYHNYSLEHICPYNPNEDWQKEFGDGIYEVADRLGNMVILENDDLKRASFIDKKKAYLQTDLRLANKVAEYESWDLATLNLYQSWLAEQAVKTWRVDYE